MTSFELLVLPKLKALPLTVTTEAFADPRNPTKATEARAKARLRGRAALDIKLSALIMIFLTLKEIEIAPYPRTVSNSAHQALGIRRFHNVMLCVLNMQHIIGSKYRI